MGLLNLVLNLVAPTAGMVMLAFAWPSLVFLHACEWLYRSYAAENMDDKVVIITGASSGIGEHIAYEYAKRRANLVLVARREGRLRGIRERARQMGARQVLVMAADVVKEEDCRRFVDEAVNRFGRVNHLVNTASLGHTFFFEDATDTSVFPLLLDINFWGNVNPTYAALPHLRRSNGRVVVNASVENWMPMPRMSLYSAAKAALTNFYETLRFELGEEVGVTIATHGAIGSEMAGGKFMLEEGAEMQWKEEREVTVTGKHVQEYARQIVNGACRGEPYVKPANWYNIFLLYKVFAPDVLGWTFRLLFLDLGGAAAAQRKISPLPLGATRLTEPTSPRKPPLPAPGAEQASSPQWQR
ncbi:11-beta-hydroxysteroid dehydrogenase-like 5 [Nymphaea thermarum]|nr:11-beta-hydroxysteroid dehydrogenase-like 5 [Nymphaea thermarum]